jgi:acetate kinase
MRNDSPCILAVNDGSPGIKFALLWTDDPLQRILQGWLERIGQPQWPMNGLALPCYKGRV